MRFLWALLFAGLLGTATYAGSYIKTYESYSPTQPFHIYETPSACVYTGGTGIAVIPRYSATDRHDFVIPDGGC